MSSTEGIPIRRMVVHDPKDMPLHYGETPGGSIFSTTPGGELFLQCPFNILIRFHYLGTRIYYDRTFLLSRRDSPMTRSPPHLPFIPEGRSNLICFILKFTVRSLVTLIPDPNKNDGSAETGTDAGNQQTASVSSAPHSNVTGTGQVAQATSNKKGLSTLFKYVCFSLDTS